MHSPLILQARRSISSESFSSCRPSARLIDVQDIRSRDSTPVLQSSPTPIFFNPRPSICLITLRQDPNSRKSGIEGYYGRRDAEPGMKGEDGSAPQEKLSNPMDGDADLEDRKQGSRSALCVLPTSGIQEKWIPGEQPASENLKFSNLLKLIILATPHCITTAVLTLMLIRRLSIVQPGFPYREWIGSVSAFMNTAIRQIHISLSSRNSVQVGWILIFSQDQRSSGRYRPRTEVEPSRCHPCTYTSLSSK
jgi:hypothetical protein